MTESQPASQPESQPDSQPDTQPALPVRAVFNLYRALVSPILHTISPSRCVYLPTCSEYAFVAVARFGLLRGSAMALRRLARCHPFATGGLDPVPQPAAGQPRPEQLP